MGMNFQLAMLGSAAVMIMMLSVYGYSEHAQKEAYKLELELIKAQSVQEKRKHEKRVESYEYAIEEIARYYDETISEVDNFQRGEHETECDAASRLLNSFKY